MSTDSRFLHKIWQEEELSKMVNGGVPFPMLTDAGGRIGAVYGVYDEDAGVDIRGPLPDRSGRNHPGHGGPDPAVGRNVAELIRQVKAFQHVAPPGKPPLPAGSRANPPSLPAPISWARCGRSGRPTSAFD